MNSLEIIRAAIACKQRKCPAETVVDEADGSSYRQEVTPLVELSASDIVAACGMIANPDARIKAIKGGSEKCLRQSKGADRRVAILVDDAAYILDCAG